MCYLLTVYKIVYISTDMSTIAGKKQKRIHPRNDVFPSLCGRIANKQSYHPNGNIQYEQHVWVNPLNE